MDGCTGVLEKFNDRSARTKYVHVPVLRVELADQVGEARWSAAQFGAVMYKEDRLSLSHDADRVD